ncbi:hypothetical protein Hanom_Chr10g00946161 [Helianthus anomalus]
MLFLFLFFIQLGNCVHRFLRVLGMVDGGWASTSAPHRMGVRSKDDGPKERGMSLKYICICCMYMYV